MGKHRTLTAVNVPCTISIMDTNTPIERAIAQAGGPAALAKLLGESIQTVSNWRSRGVAPANRCASIEQHTGVSRRELRADDWKDYWPELSEAA